MDGLLDNDEPAVRKIGLQIRDDLQVAIVSSDVVTNSSKILEKSQTYIEGRFVTKTLYQNQSSNLAVKIP